MGPRRNAYRILVGKPEGMRPLGRPIFRWVDNIKMDLRKIVPHVPLVPGNDKQTLLLLLRALRGFYGFNSYRMG
jgi:hypothetical protein